MSSLEDNLSIIRNLRSELEDLSCIEGNGTSLITLYIPPTSGQQSRANDLLKKELTQCQSIKDRSVRQAVKVCFKSKFIVCIQ